MVNLIPEIARNQLPSPARNPPQENNLRNRNRRTRNDVINLSIDESTHESSDESTDESTDESNDDDDNHDDVNDANNSTRINVREELREIAQIEKVLRQRAQDFNRRRDRIGNQPRQPTPILSTPHDQPVVSRSESSAIASDAAVIVDPGNTISENIYLLHGQMVRARQRLEQDAKKTFSLNKRTLKTEPDDSPRQKKKIVEIKEKDVKHIVSTSLTENHDESVVEIQLEQPPVINQSADDFASNEESNIEDIQPGPSGLNSKPKNEKK